jgi:hypothetical protein
MPARCCAATPPRADIPCTTCEIYLGMQRRGKWLERPEDKKGTDRLLVC